MAGWTRRRRPSFAISWPAHPGSASAGVSPEPSERHRAPTAACCSSARPKKNPGTSPRTWTSRPPGAPPHLSVGLERITRAGNGEAVFVVAPDHPGAALLERVDDARRRGAAILAMADGSTSQDNELLSLAHDALIVPENGVIPGFDAAQHLLAMAAGERPVPRQRGLRDRLSAMLDRIAGPVSQDF